MTSKIMQRERMTYRKPPKVGTAARFYYHDSDDGWPVFRFIGKCLDGTTLWRGPRHLGGYFAAKCGQHIRPATRDEWRHFRDSQRNRKHWAEIWARQPHGAVSGRPSKTANPSSGIRSDAPDKTGLRPDMSGFVRGGKASEDRTRTRTQGDYPLKGVSFCPVCPSDAVAVRTLRNEDL